jgi:hypothetical protein
MENKFEKVMSHKTDEELKEILKSSQGDYQLEAMEAALIEANKRNLNVEPSKETIDNKPAAGIIKREQEHNRYPALTIISSFFKILALLSIATTIWFIFYSMSHTEIELTEGVISVLVGLASSVIFLGISELIKVVIDIEYNTRIAATNSSK